MKTNKLYMLALAASAMALGSCSNEEVVETTQEAKPATMVFTAGLENGVSSRTELNGTSVNWVDGDAIKVFDGTTSTDFTASNVSGTTCTFSGSCSGSADNFYAVYPSSAASSSSSLSGTTITNVTLPAEQTAVEGSYDPAAAIMVATTTAAAKNFQFKNANSLIKVTPKFDCSKIIVTATGCSLAGTGTVTVSDQPTVSITGDASSTVTLNSPDGSYIMANKTYYISVLPGVSATAITVDFIAAESDDNGNLQFRKQKNASIDFTRNNIMNIGGFAKADCAPMTYSGHNNGNVPCVDLGLSTGELWAKYNVGYAEAKPYGDYFASGDADPLYSNYVFSTDAPEDNVGAYSATITWNENMGTDGYSWTNYSYNNGSEDTGTQPYQYVTDHWELKSANDAATKNLGYDWKTPTVDQFLTLRKECVWVYGIVQKFGEKWLQGVKVYRAKNAADKGRVFFYDTKKWYELSSEDDYYQTSTTVGMTEITGDEATELTENYPYNLSSTCGIFLPAGGYIDGTKYTAAGWVGRYWTTGKVGSIYVYACSFSSTNVRPKFAIERCKGLNVRGVCK